MICQNCGMQLPNDSEFCQYCGSKINTTREQAVSIFMASSPKQENTNSVQPVTTYGTPQDKEASLSARKKGASPKWIATVVCLSLLLSCALGYCLYQYEIIKNNTIQLAELSSTLEDKNVQIEKNNKEIASLNAKLSSYKNDAKNYQALVDAIQSSNLGFAAYNFKSSDSIIVVGQNEKNRKLTLTANWSYGGEVSVDYNSYSPSAYVDFDQDSWYTSTSMTIKPRKTGVSIVTFSNEAHKQSFDVIIIVI